MSLLRVKSGCEQGLIPFWRLWEELFPASRGCPHCSVCSPLQYSCLENPMDRGACQATVHGVARVGHTKPQPQELPKLLAPFSSSDRADSDQSVFLSVPFLWFSSFCVSLPCLRMSVIMLGPPVGIQHSLSKVSWWATLIPPSVQHNLCGFQRLGGGSVWGKPLTSLSYHCLTQIQFFCLDSCIAWQCATLLYLPKI